MSIAHRLVGLRRWLTTPFRQFPALARLGLFAIALLLTLTVNACSSGSTASLTPLRVGVTSWAGFDIVLYAQAADLFKQRGLDVELLRFDNQQDSARAVMRGRLDAAFTSFWDVMQVDSGSSYPVVLAATNISAGADGIVARPGIQSVKDLKGKKVGAKLGTVNHLILLEALKAHQMSPAEVTILDYSNDVCVDKIKAGELDAAVLWEPLLSATAKAINGSVVHTTRQLDSLVIDTIVSSNTIIQQKKEALLQFVLTWFDVMHAVETQPTTVFNAVGEKLGQSGAAFASDYAGVRKGDIPLNQLLFQPNGRLQSAETQIIQLLQADPRHGRVARQDVKIDGSIVREAMEAWKP